MYWLTLGAATAGPGDDFTDADRELKDGRYRQAIFLYQRGIKKGYAKGKKRKAYEKKIAKLKKKMLERTFGPSNENDAFLDIAKLKTGGVVVVGVQERQIWLLGTDAKLEVLWEKKLGRGEVRGVDLTPHGLVVCAGKKRVKRDDVLWVAAFQQETGDLVWEKDLDATVGNAVASADDGSVYVTGFRKKDVFVAKLSSDGEPLWEKIFGGSKKDEGRDIVVLQDGGCAVAGSTSSYADSWTDGYLLRLDSEGNRLWDKTYGGEKQDEFYSLAVRSDGGFVLAGDTILSRGKATGSHGEGGRDVWVVSVDESGNEIWGKNYGMLYKSWSKYSRSDSARSVEITEAGDIWLTGESGKHVLCMRVAKDGRKLWNVIFDSGYPEIGTAILPWTKQTALVCGRSGNAGVDREDGLLFKVTNGGKVIAPK